MIKTDVVFFVLMLLVMVFMGSTILPAEEPPKKPLRPFTTYSIVAIDKEAGQEDHPEPLKELKRLITVAKAYNHMNMGDEHLTHNRTKEALEEYTLGMKIYPGNLEMIFWPAVTMAASGKVDQSLPLFRKVFEKDKRWAELLRRLPGVGQFPKDKSLMDKILALVPKEK